MPRPTGSGSLPTHDAESRPFIRLQTLGAATILVGDMRVGASAGTMFSLLVRVCYATGMMVGRDELLEMLWPELSDLRRRGNLRQLLYKLRGYGVRIAMVGDAVQLDVDQVVDTFSLERTSEYFDRDVTHGHEPFGTFLPGFVVPWPELQRWIDEQRELIHADVRHVLVEQLRRRRERADWGGAEALARSLLQFDALNEEATLTIAECTALSGSKSEAVAILDRYLEELGASAGDIRLPASLLRKRILDPAPRTRRSFAPTERHFVGRETELADLTLAMRRARWHDGSAVLVHGPAGMGKSRLAHELTKVATIEGIAVQQVACREGDLERAWSIFVDLMPDLLGQAGALGCSPENLAVLRSFVPQDRSTIASTGSANTIAAREPMPSALAFRRAIAELFSALSHEKPILLVVDDVHWIDERSWDALSDLIERIESLRVFVLMLSREPHARPHPPQRVPIAMRVVKLPALSAEQCGHLSRAIGNDLSASVTDALTEWFVRASEGNPLFLRSLVNHWIESGEAGGVPPTLQRVLEQRLNQLSGDALRVLQTAALLGRWASVERIANVLQLKTHEMLRCLDEISTMCAFAGVGNVLMTHELVGRSALAMLSSVSAVALRRNIADELLSESEKSAMNDILLDGLLHLEHAMDNPRLIRETLSRLDRIVEDSIPAQGLLAVRRIAGLVHPSTVPSEIEAAIARLHLLAGDYSKALASKTGDLDSVGLSSQVSDSDANLRLTLIDSAYRVAETSDRARLFQSSIEIAELPQLAAATRIRAADTALIMLANEGRPDLAHRVFRGVEALESEPNSSDLWRRMAILYHTMFGERLKAALLAAECYERARNASASTTSYVDATRAGISQRIVCHGTGHFQSLILSISIAETVGVPHHGLNSAWHLAQSYLELGFLKDAIEQSKIVRRLFEEIRDPVAGGFSLSLFCRLAIESGDPEDAEYWLRKFLDTQLKAPTLRARSYASALRMGVQLLDPGYAPSNHAIDDLNLMFQQIASSANTDFTLSTLVSAMIRIGRNKDGRRTLERYLTSQRREVGTIGPRLARVIVQLGIDCKHSLCLDHS